jgi:hypothetical protein
MFDFIDSDNSANALAADEKLRSIVFYEVTEGLYFKPPEDFEEMMEIQSKVAHRFSYYRRLIRRGEITLNELISDITKKFSTIYNIENKNLKSEETDWDEYLKEVESNIAYKESMERTKSILSGFFEYMKLIDSIRKPKLGYIQGEASDIQIMNVALTPSDVEKQYAQDLQKDVEDVEDAEEVEDYEDIEEEYPDSSSVDESLKKFNSNENKNKDGFGIIKKIKRLFNLRKRS